MLNVILFILVILIFGYVIYTFASLAWMILDDIFCELTDGAVPLGFVVFVAGVCGIIYWIFF